jgi:ribosomal protein S18 acetylase RimI-like enzyme
MSQEVQIRQAISSDVPKFVQMDHGLSTDHVWQLSLNKQVGEIAATFREVRLPRPMQIAYPRDPERLPDEWTRFAALLLAERDEVPMGYLALKHGMAERSGWITDVVVDLRFRRQGVGSRLLRAATLWCHERDYQRLFMEMQSKNYPAIALAKQNGFQYAGYSDIYYRDQDIALFFVNEIRSKG